MRAFLDAVRRRIRRPPSQPVILLYHRVATPAVDPWGLAVRPERFEEHLRALRRSRRPLAMSDFFNRLERGALPSNAVAVTFDDGYADNLRQAKPRLAAADVPATLFLTTGGVGQRTEYWWDELARGILLHEGALDCEVVIAGEPCRLAFARGEETPEDCAWRAWEEPRTERHATYLAVWRRLRTVSAREREEVMNRLRDILNSTPSASADLPMTEREVAELAADGLFEIGSHTVTHPVLPTLNPAERRREILGGKRACERLVTTAVAGFAYPHGALDDDSRAAVQECGLIWACSTEARSVSNRDYDRYALPRVGILDSDGHAFERALQAACS